MLEKSILNELTLQFKTGIELTEHVSSVLEAYGGNDNTKDPFKEELSQWIAYFKQSLFKDSIKRRFRSYGSGDTSLSTFTKYLQDSLDKSMVEITPDQRARYIELVRYCFNINLEDING